MRSFPVLVVVALLVGVALAAPEDVQSRNEKEKEALDKSHTSSVTGEDVTALSKVDCGEMNGTCTECLALVHCRYLVHHNRCIDETDLVNHKKAKIATSASSCPLTSDAPALANPAFRADDTTSTTTTTPSSTTSSATIETTTTTTPVTTTTSDNSTTATTVPTTTAANVTTTTTTTESTTSTASSTTSPNSTTIPTTTSTTSRPATTPTPDPSGRKFDGWSFFGGILVTMTLAAIGYMSFRYYKSRSGTGGGTIYNRF